MILRPQDITIAVTVYNRREFVLEAIQSALAQSAPVKVIVVEDCGPDAGLRDFVLKKFGTRIEYFRNPKNRGLFDNWNACIENCRTAWLSILHDDDVLLPEFVATMVHLAEVVPERAFYHGEAAMMDENGKAISTPSVWNEGWREIDLAEMADQGFSMMFAGNLFSIEAAKKIGGFRRNSYYSGDWDFWFRLALFGGGVRTATVVAMTRTHFGPERGTTRVDRMGWRWALENVQRKRDLALLAGQKGIHVRFDRAKHLEKSPIPSRLLLRNAKNYSRRVLKYNAWLFVHSHPPHFQYSVLQRLVRLFGEKVLRILSRSFYR